MTSETQNGFEIAGGPPRFLHHPATSAIAPHGFFSAAGGHSSGIYESLNCGFGSDDDHLLVSRNRAAAAGARFSSVENHTNSRFPVEINPFC